MLESACLEVEVNGEEVFLIDMNVLTRFSGRLRKLFSQRPVNRFNAGRLKVVFHDFPGGAEGFELTSRFCYDNGRIGITPHNIVLLHRLADFMEMEEEYRKFNLRYRTVNALRGISFWSWSELLVALRHCQSLLDPGNPSSYVDEILDCLIWRISSRNISSSCTTSTDSCHSSCTCSSDLSSMSRLKSNCSEGTRSWWFQDLLFLDGDWICKITQSVTMKNRGLDVLSKFLLYYLRSASVHDSAVNRGKIVEAIISMSSITGAKPNSVASCRYLFELHRVVTGLGVSRKHTTLVEETIGSKLDEATVDQLLLRSPRGEASAYNTSFVIRICNAFLSKGNTLQSQDRLERVARLIDSYAYEVAPDPNLSPSQFIELVTAVPATARRSCEQINKAIEMFHEVHSNASGEEKSKVYKMLRRIEPGDDLVKNTRLPGPARIKVRGRLTRPLDLKC